MRLQAIYHHHPRHQHHQPHRHRYHRHNQNGKKIWEALWEFRHPDLDCFTAQVTSHILTAVPTFWILVIVPTFLF